MSSNLLGSFPMVFELSNLKTLKLGLNKITELPSSFGAAADSLKYLDVSENPFAINAEFWASLMTLRNLKTLILDEITLGSIPEDFFNAFPKLEALHLMGCLVISLPESVGQCQKLRTVDLRYNRNPLCRLITSR
jgi:Leucine-rich repeat (LRR) protein